MTCEHDISSLQFNTFWSWWHFFLHLHAFLAVKWMYLNIFYFIAYRLLLRMIGTWQVLLLYPKSIAIHMILIVFEHNIILCRFAIPRCCIILPFLSLNIYETIVSPRILKHLPFKFNNVFIYFSFSLSCMISS